MKNVLYDAILISPHYGYDDDGIPLLRKDNLDDMSDIVPLGILSITQYLSDKGFCVKLVHLPHEFKNISKNKKITLVDILKKYPARVVGIQAHWFLYIDGMKQVAEQYKKLFPKAFIFTGGFHATGIWREILDNINEIDGVITGEGEKTMESIVACVVNKDLQKIEKIPGIAFKKKKRIIPHSENSLIKADEIPIIRPKENHFSNVIFNDLFYINISRGVCLQECAYCVANNKDINTRDFIHKPIKKIIEQLHIYQDMGCKELFLGENHFLDIVFMKKLIDAIIREKFSMFFRLETHPMIFENKDLLIKMINAGFISYTMGCESGSNKILNQIGRRSTVKQILNVVEDITKAGGVVLTSWICNLPGETEKDHKKTLSLMREVVKRGGLVYWIENLHVLPGSKISMNPEYYNVRPLLINFDDWTRWAQISKEYFSIKNILDEPLKYLTHVNLNSNPNIMVKRFLKTRIFAKKLVPEMRYRLLIHEKKGTLPIDSHLKQLEWYENYGWRLLVF